MANFSKSNVPQFSVEVYQNEFLPEGGREVNAIVTVASTGGGTLGGTPFGTASASPSYIPGRPPTAAVVIMVDCSGSMEYPPTKMRNARDATAAAIDTLRDGVAFAVVSGTHIAREVYPGNGRLATADSQTRTQAKEALRKLSAGGGTAIGTWLRLADRLLASADVPIRHGILLTDGRNEHESPEDLRSALDACAGRFTCDARGVGTDWEVKEVTSISSALLGTADIVADPANLAADFTQMMENAMGKEVADVSLRLWTPVGVEIKFVKQVAPTVEELTDRRTEAGPRAGDYPTGSWGDESRDYHVCVQVPQANVGQEMLAARVSLIVPDREGGTPQLLSQGLVRAVWTDDMAASTSINPQVAHYTGQAELAQVIQQGLDARKSGDVDGATAKLGRAVQLAAASGNAGTAKLLAKVVDVVDEATGTVRLKAKVAEADEMTLETRSTKTVRVKK
ncbi:VWA domain-containing protein [Streptomyces xanthochromogenes]|uniref:VWA domain-containing protein n=1 Tax=Streptomyces xanthochromogenes TaxID=67384 RepID=A0ABQ2ZQA3_9ACTN|nr:MULTISPECIES: VWA domain-containing protein [Streptomyces]MYV95105.1 VWA domain-containing protein [Streptomyces sp. SID1034]GGY22447.1 VWA domain-containing protein [Streptomyces xanthochromogenes]